MGSRNYVLTTPTVHVGRRVDWIADNSD